MQHGNQAIRMSATAIGLVDRLRHYDEVLNSDGWAHKPDLNNNAYSDVTNAYNALDAYIARLEAYYWLTPIELTAVIIELLLTRQGEVLTEQLAEERARNIATVLNGILITDTNPPGGPHE